MAPAVEARSLSSITTLAANPPLYPRNPTQEIQQPLVLYIARVPGSKGDKPVRVGLPSYRNSSLFRRVPDDLETSGESGYCGGRPELTLLSTR